MPRAFSVEELLAKGPMDESPELRLLFHRLNNQLGIILAHAELLESKAPDEMNRSRAAQVVSSTLEAMGTAKEIRRVSAAASRTAIASQECNSTIKLLTLLRTTIVKFMTIFTLLRPHLHAAFRNCSQPLTHLYSV